MTYRAFPNDIARMNRTYALDTIDDLDFSTRLKQFYKILGDELLEIEPLIAEADSVGGNITSADSLRIRVGVADLLADLIVYCSSEAQRWQIPLDGALAIVMQSNFSKLGPNGEVYKDAATDKFLKGPNYWKPEPMLAKLIASSMANAAFDGTASDDGTTLVNIDMDAVTAAATKTTTTTTVQDGVVAINAVDVVIAGTATGVTTVDPATQELTSQTAPPVA